MRSVVEQTIICFLPVVVRYYVMQMAQIYSALYVLLMQILFPICDHIFELI